MHKTELMRVCGGAGRTDRSHHREAAAGLRHWTFESGLVNYVGVFQVEVTGEIQPSHRRAECVWEVISPVRLSL